MVMRVRIGWCIVLLPLLLSGCASLEAFLSPRYEATIVWNDRTVDLGKYSFYYVFPWQESKGWVPAMPLGIGMNDRQFPYRSFITGTLGLRTRLWAFGDYFQLTRESLSPTVPAVRIEQEIKNPFKLWPTPHGRCGLLLYFYFNRLTMRFYEPGAEVPFVVLTCSYPYAGAWPFTVQELERTLIALWQASASRSRADLAVYLRLEKDEPSPTRPDLVDVEWRSPEKPFREKDLHYRPGWNDRRRRNRRIRMTGGGQ